MNLKYLFASFALVFLAELGDKTQLTALAFTAESKSPWSVFVGTSLALVCSTAVAVAFGHLLTKRVPENILNLAAGVMFVLVGLILLVNMARKAPVEKKGGAKEPAAAEEVSGLRIEGPLATFVAGQAIVFEEDLVALIRQALAGSEPGPRQDALRNLIREHEQHVAVIRGVSGDADDHAIREMSEDLSRGNPEALLASLEQNGPEADDDILAEIIRRQEAAAEFYIALARLIRFHGARDALRDLAMQEVQSAQSLCDLLNHAPRTDATV